MTHQPLVRPVNASTIRPCSTGALNSSSKPQPDVVAHAVDFPCNGLGWGGNPHGHLPQFIQNPIKLKPAFNHASLC